MFCSNCGTQISEGSVFCPNCGTKVAADAAAPEVPVQPVEAAPQQAPVYQQKKIFTSTLESVAGAKAESLGIVMGSVVSSRNVGKDLLAGFKNMAGGEIRSYTELAMEARKVAADRMIIEARALDADAVLGVRYSSAPISVEGAIEVLAYGTAVKFISE